jgi:hypothetical protein
MSFMAAIVIALAISSGEFRGKPEFFHSLRSVGDVNVVSVSHGAIADICD